MHIAVLQKEVLQYLDPKPGENFIDATYGQGGHAATILEKNGPKGKVLGIEWDPELYNRFKKDLVRFDLTKRVILVNDSYSNLKEIVERENFRPVSGILFDLGLSSWHLEKSSRGFSFLRNEPLDMRYCIPIASFRRPSKTCYRGTAKDILNNWSEEEIEKILREYGGERFAKKISDKIAKTRKIRPIETTFQLVEIINKVVPAWYRGKRIHFATRTFQALRIAVNDELNNLRKALPRALEVLEPGGRLVVISFHSLEDRIVKNFFQENFKKNCLTKLTKKSIKPQKEEISINPRARSAKLRAAIKL